jgi:hypothetical protein
VDRMQYYQHSRQTKSSKPRRDVRQVGPEDAPPPEELRELKQVSELVKRLGDREELGKQVSEMVHGLTSRAPSPRRSDTPSEERRSAGCFKCGDPGHVKRECPLLQGKPEPGRGQGKQTRPTEQEGQRGRGPRIRYSLSGDGARHKEVRALVCV